MNLNHRRSKMNSSPFEDLTTLIGVLGVFALMMVWGGYVLSILWSWFIVPAFEVSSLGLAEAVGITIIIKYMTRTIEKKEEVSMEYLANQTKSAIMTPLLALSLGYLVQFFI